MAYLISEAFAFKYGPYLLSAELGTEDMETTWTGVGPHSKGKTLLIGENSYPRRHKTRRILKKNRVTLLRDTGAEGAPG